MKTIYRLLLDIEENLSDHYKQDVALVVGIDRDGNLLVRTVINRQPISIRMSPALLSTHSDKVLINKLINTIIEEEMDSKANVPVSMELH